MNILLSLFRIGFLSILLAAAALATDVLAAKPASKAWVRVALLEPADSPWQVDINILPAGGAKPSNLPVGQTITTRPGETKPQAAGQSRSKTG